MKAMAEKAIARGTDNNQLKGAEEETMAVVMVTETATKMAMAMETATVIARITMLMLNTGH
jgi:hypothetical protein